MVFVAGPVQGKTLLVTGGAGAVGHYAVQLATWAGARVIATVSSAEKAERARVGGAAHVIDYRREDVAARQPGWVDAQLLPVGLGPFDRGAHTLEELGHDVDVLDARDILELALFVGQQAGGEDGEDGILGATDGDSPDQSSSPLDLELGH
jgi:NADPH:quinone reductase-like Zn-dependent oxidoreductase